MVPNHEVVAHTRRSEEIKNLSRNRYWEPGRLDLSREIETTASPSVELNLIRVPIPPSYMSLILRGDPFAPNDYENYMVPRAGHQGITIPFEREAPTGEGEREAAIFVDFGRNFPGTLAFDADVPAGVEIVIETGESIQPTRAYHADVVPDGENKTFGPKIAHAGWGCLRFAYIRFRGMTSSFTVSNMRGVMQILPCVYEGDFSCSDEILNRVWEVCAYSAHTVMAQPVGDDPAPQPRLQTLCLDRCDRFPWAGDSRQIQIAVEAVFGQYDLIRSSIELMLPTGTRPIPDLQDIPPYTLDWALGLIQYYRASGDREYLLQRLDDIREIVKKYDIPVEEQGYWLLFDWDRRIVSEKPVPPDMRRQQEMAFIGKYVEMCRDAVWLADSLGNLDTASEFQEVADRHALQWSYDPTVDYGIHAASNMINGGVIGDPDYDAIFRRVYLRPEDRWTESPFFSWSILRALSRIRRHEEAVEMVRDYWGSMIECGATTVWEEWHPFWHLPCNAQPPQLGPDFAWGGLSLNQPLGSAPAWWLIAEVLGINPEEPGFRCIRIEPHMCGLEWAKGSRATPHGRVNVEWKRQADSLIVDFDIPSGCESALVVLPAASRFSVDGEARDCDRAEPTGNSVFKLGSGTHNLTAFDVVVYK